jgi:hypothetical protein
VQTLQYLNAEMLKGVPPGNLHKEAESRLGISLTDQELRTLCEVPAAAEVLEQLRSLVSRALAGKVVGNRQLF